jgi:hypothetical protein
MIKFLMMKNILSCTLSINIPQFVVTSSADGESRPIYGLEDMASDTFLYMGGRIIYGLVHHALHRRSTIARNDMY